MKKTKTQYSVSFLKESDEMVEPYQRALALLGCKIDWIFKYEALLTLSERHSDPLVVIVDLDCLQQPLEVPLENLRAAFPQSDFIALSGTDTAQVAMQCFRSGFTDFLLKPVSPEELAWSVRKCQQRRDLLQQLEDPRSQLIRALVRISSCTTPTLARLSTLEYLHGYLDSTGAAWITKERRGKTVARVLCSTPKGLSEAKILAKLPHGNRGRKAVPVLNQSEKTLTIPCQNPGQGMLFFWGLKRPVSQAKLGQACVVLEHSELSLLNIQKYDEIKQQTFVDDLTGLYNVRYLKFALTNAIKEAKQANGGKGGGGFSILFIDVDHFKRVNDVNGHVIGSEFLVTIAKTVRNSVRDKDIVFRYGGDEFVVILHDANQLGAMEIAERIRRHIERRVFVIKNQRIQTTVSIGVAVYPHHTTEVDQLMRLADEAMYSVKRNSRNAVYLAPPPKTPAITKTKIKPRHSL